MFQLKRQVDAAAFGSVNGVRGRHRRVYSARGRSRSRACGGREGSSQVGQMWSQRFGLGIRWWESTSRPSFTSYVYTEFVPGPHSTRSNLVSTQPPRGALDHCSAVRVNAPCVIWNLDMNTYYAYTFGRAQAHSGQTLALHICVAASITALHQAGYSSDSGAFLIHALCSFGSSLGFQNSIEVLQTCRSCPSAQPSILSRAR